MDEDEKLIDAPLQPDESGDEGENNADPSDKLTPDHPRFKQVLQQNKELKGELSELREEMKSLSSQIQQRQESTGDDELTDEEKASMAKIQRQLKKEGFMTQSEFNKEQQVNQIATALEELSGQYDGSNSFPKFVAEDIVAYASENGFSSTKRGLLAAYKDMHEDAYMDARAKEKSSLPKPPRLERPTGGDRNVAVTDLTEDDVANMSEEEYDKVRDKIMAGLKQSVNKGK